MYLVKIYDGPKDFLGTVIHSPYVSDLKLSSAEVNVVLDGVSDMKFRINPQNPGWNNIDPLVTLIEVTDAKRNKVVFSGRVLQPVQKMDNNGHFSIEYVCESKLAYLHDSSQRHGEYRNMTVRDFFEVIIGKHNRDVEPHKRFKVGEVTVTNSTDNVYRYLGYEDTYDTIKDKLIDRLGGFLRLREEPDGTYIDYLESVGEQKNTPIQLRTNLQDMQRETDPTSVITRLVPVGARVESDNPEATDASQARVTIASANNGVDYLDDASMIAEFGVIEKSVTWDDVHEPNILKTRGQQFLQAQKAARISYDVTPLDLNLIDATFESFEVGNWHPIENPVFAIKEPLQIIEKTIDLMNPQRSKLTIGEKHRTLSEYQAEANKQMMVVRDLEDRVTRLGVSNARLTQQLQQANSDLETIQQNLLNVDLDNLPEELQGISGQIETLQRTINELDIPEYGLVTNVEAGLMSPSDKRKLDLIKATTLVDLDDLVRRVTELEQPPQAEEPTTEGGI